MIEYIYIILFKILYFFSISSRYNAQLTYASGNISLTIGLVFSLFHGNDEHLQVFQFTVWTVISSGHVFTTSNQLQAFDSK